jgi:hypothetical protein
MATLVSEIVVQAFREGNFVAVGETTTQEELMEAVPRLNNLISALFGIELGEGFRDWYVPSEWDPAAPLRFPLTPTGTGAAAAEPWAYPAPNVRLLVKIDEPMTVYFPSTPSDGARMSYVDAGSSADITIDGNGRLIEGAATLTEEPADLSGRKWLYRADLANWIKLGVLSASDEVPLPEEFDDLLVCGLTIRLAPRFSVPVDETIKQRYVDMLDRLKKRYKQTERMPSSIELRSMFREI